MAQFHGHRVEIVQMLETRPGFLGTRNFMCIRGDLPCHIFLYPPATPQSRPVKRVCMATSFPRNFGTSRFVNSSILV